jgi:general secretion pathway protein D
VASETSNAVLLRGDPASVTRARQVALQLDTTEPQRDNIRIIPLNYADAGEIVPILERVGLSVAAQRAPSDTSVPAQTISHHPATNSLIISGNAETLVAMEKVIAALDVRRPQVMVEAIIVEMSDDMTKELGLQFLLSGTGSSNVPFASTNFSGSAPNLLALTGALLTDGFEDLTKANPLRDSAISSLTGTAGLTLGFGGQSGDNLFGVILNAVEKDSNSRILSTPFGMTLNNATSALIVGQEVPITTGQVLDQANSNPFRTVERQDVGIQLEVTPRIGENDTVRLDIRRIESLKDGAEVVGSRTRVKVVKNKVAPPFRQAEFDIMYGKGISREGAVLDMAVEMGIAKKSGAWFTYEGEQLGQGRENAKTFLVENPEIMVQIAERVRQQAGVDIAADQTEFTPDDDEPIDLD